MEHEAGKRNKPANAESLLAVLSEVEPLDEDFPPIPDLLTRPVRA